MQQRHARGPAFRTLLGQVVQTLEGMPQAERLRWLEMLSYIHALVYHEREPGEREDLQAHIGKSVKSDPHRQEVNAMRKTIADVLKEEGRTEGFLKARREMLLEAIRVRFEEPPANVRDAIEACTDIAQLDAWFRLALTARRLANVGISSPS